MGVFSRPMALRLPFTRPPPTPCDACQHALSSYLGLAAAGLEVLGKDSGVGI